MQLCTVGACVQIIDDYWAAIRGGVDSKDRPSRKKRASLTVKRARYDIAWCNGTVHEDPGTLQCLIHPCFRLKFDYFNAGQARCVAFSVIYHNGYVIKGTFFETQNGGLRSMHLLTSMGASVLSAISWLTNVWMKSEIWTVGGSIMF